MNKTLFASHNVFKGEREAGMKKICWSPRKKDERVKAKT